MRKQQTFIEHENKFRLYLAGNNKKSHTINRKINRKIE